MITITNIRDVGLDHDGSHTAEPPRKTYSVSAESGSPIVVPSRLCLIEATFTRLGPDLLITDPGGTSLLVTDYFAVAEGEENKIALLPNADGTVGSMVISTEAGHTVVTEVNTAYRVKSAFMAPESITFDQVEFEQTSGSALKVLSLSSGHRASRQDEQAADGADAEGDADNGTDEGSEGAAADGEAASEEVAAQEEEVVAEEEAPTGTQSEPQNSPPPDPRTLKARWINNKARRIPSYRGWLLDRSPHWPVRGRSHLPISANSVP